MLKNNKKISEKLSCVFVRSETFQTTLVLNESDLTRLNFYFHNCSKSMVCVNKSQTLRALKLNVERFICEIRSDLLHKVI